MRRVLVGICLTAVAVLPGAVALAHSVQPANLPDGRTMIKSSGYVDVEYNRKLKKITYIQVYYPCRAAGAAHSKYPAYLSLATSSARVPLHSGAASGTFSTKIGNDITITRAVGKTATVNWAISGIKIETAGLAGKLSIKVSGPSAVCPFSFSGKKLVPLNDIPGD
jgi:hypothetical protein